MLLSFFVKIYLKPRLHLNFSSKIQGREGTLVASLIVFLPSRPALRKIKGELLITSGSPFFFLNGLTLEDISEREVVQL